MRMRAHTGDFFRDLSLVRFTGISSDISYSDLPIEGEYVLIPKITSDIDSDVMKQRAVLQRFEKIENFSPQLRKHFILPKKTTNITLLATPHKREIPTLIFEGFKTSNIETDDVVHLLNQIIRKILITNNLNIYYRYIQNLRFENLVKDSQTHTLLILATPVSNSNIPLVEQLTDNTELTHLLRLLDVRKHYYNSEPLPLNDIDRFLVSIIDTYMELPNSKETTQYSESRIVQNSRNCHPIQKDSVGNYVESDEGNTKRYIRITDKKETLEDRKILEDEFCNFIVYIDATDNIIRLKIAVANVNFEDIGSKHAHVVLGMLPKDFYFLFSGELMRDRGFVRYNLNSGMFYHLQLDTNRKNTLTFDNFNNFNKSKEEEYLFSLFSKDLFNWEVLSESILQSLLGHRVFLDDSGLRPKLTMGEAQLMRFCEVEEFSFKEYPSKHHCQILRSGRERC